MLTSHSSMVGILAYKRLQPVNAARLALFEQGHPVFLLPYLYNPPFCSTFVPKYNMDNDKTHINEAEQRLVTVVIPIYTLDLNETELMALRQCFAVLGSHDIAVIKPRSLDVSRLSELVGTEPCYRVESFDDSYFAGREGYNRLMLSTSLYERFITSRYIMICQTDVYVFKDELAEWCHRGYDYIGAPWLPAVGDVSGWNVIQRAIYQLRRALGKKKSSSHAINLKFRVGNGGCSLRHTRHMLEQAARLAAEFAEINSAPYSPENYEDVVWSIRVNELNPGALQVAPWQEAVHFSIESHPTMAMRLTGGRLPMATHAFARRRNRSYWKQHIPGLR